MKKKLLFCLWFIITFNLVIAKSALAIPSPDVVVGLFASTAQVIVLLTATVGGLGIAKQRHKSLSGQTNKSGKHNQKFLWIAIILLIISCGINLLQYSYHLEQRNIRLQTNLTRSSVERGEAVGDTSLKTLSFSEQFNHPQGITSDELETYLNSKSAQLNIIDIREPEEVETGKLKEANIVNYPDILNNPQLAQEKGKETILFCFSGNRSSELCDVLNKAGLPCKFVIGGYEKWIAEGRTIDQDDPRKDLRAIADYPNKNVLLDTPQVQKLVRHKDAIFVDVRYPEDFKLEHLPGAFNLPIRKLTTAESDSQINNLPKRPVIAACYDKRSCFYSLIMGLRLYRHGYEYLGRYTVPHEYVEPTSEKDYIEEWQTNNDRTFLVQIALPLQQTLLFINQKVNNLPVAILLTVLCLRLLITPVTFKGEKDQITLQKLSPHIQELKEKWGKDQQKYSRSIVRLYKEHKLTPVFNLLGTFVQILVFILLFRAVNQVTQNSNESFFWVSSLANPDNYYLFPLLISGLTCLTVRLNADNPTQKLSLFIQIGSGILLFIMTFRLSVGVNLYLVFSLLLMLLQKKLIAKYLELKSIDSRLDNDIPTITSDKIVPLNQAHRVVGCGRKASCLGQLIEDGITVPRGFVIPATILANSSPEKVILSPQHHQQIDRFWRKLKLDLVAVRSSGENEDGEEYSYAGMFASVLNVKREKFVDAVQKVYDSQFSSRVDVYQQQNSQFPIVGGILVQEMVTAEFSGVMFTQHPANKNHLLIEVISGLAKDLVSGKVTPKAFTFSGITHQLLSSEIPPIDLIPLIKLGERIEKKFNHPQDIEWSYVDGKFIILQARDITASLDIDFTQEDSVLLSAKIFELEKYRLLNQVKDGKPNEVVFVQNELSELLPHPTPLSLSIMECLWKMGGSTDLACQNFGLFYDVADDDKYNFITTVFGALYINCLEEKQHRHLDLNFFTSLQLIKKIDRLEEDYRDHFLPHFQQQVRLKEAVDFTRFGNPELIDLWQDWRNHFVEQTYVQAQMINIAAEFSIQLAQRELKQHNLNPAIYLTQNSEKTVVYEAMALLPQIQMGKLSINDFLKVFGHRALYDFELSQPRYAESPQLVKQLLANASDKMNHQPSESLKLPSSKILQVTVERAHKFQLLKEEAKHQSLRELALLRYLLLELGRRYDLGTDVFYLLENEICNLEFVDFQELIAYRKWEAQQKMKLSKQLNLPPQLTLQEFDALTLERKNNHCVGKDLLRGNLVAGNAPIEGIVQVIVDDRDLDKFEPGNILVTRFTHPGWIPLFPQAKAIITELGGWLSHAAIIAREFNIPTIVGASGVLHQLHTGAKIRMNADGTIEQLTVKS